MPSRRVPAAFHLLITLIVLFATLLSAYPAQAADDYTLANGRFYTQTGDRPGAGFAVRDAVPNNGGPVIRFWSEFQRLGGVPILGYPISRAYRDGDGFYYQLFQRAMLQWRPEANTAVLANLMDQMSGSNADQWLAAQGIPSPIADDGSKGNAALSVQTRLSWLTQPQIKAQYLAASPTRDPREASARYGLPTSLPVRAGPFIVQRFQRVVLQLWLDRVPGMPLPGTVVPVLAGDLFKQYALTQGLGITDVRFVPEGVPTPSATVPASAPASDGASLVDAGLRYPIDLLAANPEGKDLAATIRSARVRVSFEDVSAIALFSPAQMSISIDPDLRDIDPKTLAAVLAHEASHLSDYLNKVDMTSAYGCYHTEYSAFERQARVWRAFYGPNGKPHPTNSVDEELNRILSGITNDPQGFSSTIVSAYRGECGE